MQNMRRKFGTILGWVNDDGFHFLGVNYTIYVFGVQNELEVNSYPQSYASY